MATIKEECEDELESLEAESEFGSVISDSDTTIEFAFTTPLPPIGRKGSGRGEDESEADDWSSVNSLKAYGPRRGRFLRRASCPDIMGWDRDHLKYLVAGSNRLPDPVVSRAYQSLLSHTEPILKQNKPKEKRLLSYYDYIPSRKVYNERDQVIKDQERDVFKFDLMIEEHRKHQEAIAMEKELMGDDYDDLQDGKVEQEDLEDIMLQRRLRRLNITDSAYQGFFPQMDLYDFGQMEKDRQRQAHASSVRSRGKVQRRGSEHLAKHKDSKPGTAGQTGQTGSRSERQLSRKDSFNSNLSQTTSSDQSDIPRRLERRSTQTKITALSHPPHHHRFVNSAQPPTTQGKPENQEMKFHVLSAMKSRFPHVHGTNSGLTEANLTPVRPSQVPVTSPASTKFRRKRSMSLGNPSMPMPLKLAETTP